MTAKQITFLLVNSLLFSIIHAQYQNFDLSKYKLPDIKTSSLDFNFTANQFYSNSFQRADLQTSIQRQSSLGGLINAAYSNFRNSGHYQGTQLATLNLNPSYSNSGNVDNKTIGNTFYGYLSLNSINRFYNSSLLFVEADPSLSIHLSYNKSSTGPRSSYNNENRFSFSVPLSIGYGRIEPIEDARLAIYILEDLTKNGKITNRPSDATILEFARQISKIKRKRFFDARLRKIEELQVIDTFLTTNKIISTNDIRYFTSLNDQWDFAAGPSRKSGFSVNVGFDNNISIYRSADENYTSKSRTNADYINNNTYRIGALLRFDYMKPLNLYWQSDFYSLSYFDREFTRDPSDRVSLTNNFNNNIFYTSLNYTIQFLPNSRTSIAWTVGGYYKNTSGKRQRIALPLTIDGRFKEKMLSFTSSLHMYYYFSPQLRILLDWSLSPLSDNSETHFERTFSDDILKTTNFNNYITLGFIYSIF